jgi:hypothetical protein
MCHNEVGSSLSLRSWARFGSALSILDYANLGSSVSLRNFARLGSGLSLYGVPKPTATNQPKEAKFQMGGHRSADEPKETNLSVN